MQGKVMSEHSASHEVGVGIDVCKEWLDIHILPAGTVLRFSNTKKGHKQLLSALKPLVVRIVVMEATGKYHRGVHRFLHDAGLSIAVVNPLRARLFAESLGALAKTDSVDARMLAAFGLMARLAATPPLPETIENLSEIVRNREAAIAAGTALENQLATPPSRASSTRSNVRSRAPKPRQARSKRWPFKPSKPILGSRAGSPSSSPFLAWEP